MVVLRPAIWLLLSRITWSVVRAWTCSAVSAASWPAVSATRSLVSSQTSWSVVSAWICALVSGSSDFNAAIWSVLNTASCSGRSDGRILVDSMNSCAVVSAIS